MHENLNRQVVCRTIEGATKEARAGDLAFRPSVYGVIINDGKVLLVPQWDGYDFPGGGIDKGERIEAALIREVKEETGLDVTPGKLLRVSDDFFLRPKTGDPLHSILMFYTCKVNGGTLSTAGFSEFEKEIAKEAEWVPIETALTAKFYNPIDSSALIKQATGRKSPFNALMQVGLVGFTLLGFLLTSFKLPQYGLVSLLISEIFWLYSSYRAWRDANQLGILITTIFVTLTILFGVINYWLL